MSKTVNVAYFGMDQQQLKNIVEAALVAAGRALTLDELQNLFGDKSRPDRARIRKALKELAGDYENRGIEIVEVGNGFRVQTRPDISEWVSRLWEERPPRYSRALMETLALIAYRQPLTRGEIESVRGVSVSTSIMRTLLERNWIKAAGHRDVPGRPALYVTTRSFLDYFGLKRLDDLPTLDELPDPDSLNPELDLDMPEPDQQQQSATIVELHPAQPGETVAELPVDETETDDPE